MRCKAGDLAVVIHSPIDKQYVGTIVNVLYRLYPDERGVVHLNGTDFQHHSGGGTTDPTWAIESLGRQFVLRGGQLANIVPCSDSCLRPIRDGNGVDETLRNLEITV